MQGARRALTLLTLAIAVASCGGGGGGPAPAPEISLSGTLDSTYGTAGRVSVPQGWPNIAVDRAGNVFVGGEAVTKFDAAGRPAADFVDGGPAGGAFVTVDASGNVYTIHNTASLPFVLVKRDAMGHLVPSFGQGGLVDLKAVRATLGTDGLFVDAAGNVYVREAWHPPTSARPVIFYVAKLDASGLAVSSFGSRADATLELPSDFNLAAPVPSVDAAGTVVTTAPALGGNIAVVGFDANGRPATGFRSGTTPVPCANLALRGAAVERDSAGNIYVGTSCSGSTDTRERIFVVKLDAVGNPVTTFGAGGVAADFVLAGPGATAIAALRPAADGGIYVAAYDPANECGGMAIAKLGADGKLVDAFGEHGVKRLDLAVGVMMAVDFSGRLYVAGRDRPTICPRLLGTQLSYSVYRLNG